MGEDGSGEEEAGEEEDGEGEEEEDDGDSRLEDWGSSTRSLFERLGWPSIPVSSLLSSLSPDSRGRFSVSWLIGGLLPMLSPAGSTASRDAVGWG